MRRKLCPCSREPTVRVGPFRVTSTAPGQGPQGQLTVNDFAGICPEKPVQPPLEFS